MSRRTFGFFLLAGCSPDGIAVGVPWLDVPPSLVFDDAEVLVPNVLGVPVANTGTAEATVMVTVVSPFSVPVDEFNVPADDVADLALFVTPQSYEPLVGRLTLTVGDDRYPVEVTVRIDRDLDDDGHDAIAAGGDDCDDLDPEVFGDTWWTDADRDGYGDTFAAPTVGCDAPPGSVANDADCDDADPGRSPDVAEVWYDGTDQDCDGNDDDQDLDGHGIDVDCNDVDAAIHPDAAEVWYDGVDQDCDGNDDDQDGDGAGMLADCNDLDATIGPLAPELDDGLDQDCDGLVDDGIWVRGTLLVTELMLFPGAISETFGRYFEIYNPTDGHVVLSEVEVGVDTIVRTFPNAPTLAPGAVAVLCNSSDLAQNGGVACAAEVSWPGGTRDVRLTGGGVVLDEVGWLSWATPPTGVALELALSQLDPDANDVETSWCGATAVFGLGDYGTPGTIATPCQ